MSHEKREQYRVSYDAVAEEYARRILDELAHKPFDRAQLDRFAEAIGDGLACDLGCGPGQIARYLHERGVKACGIDLSPEMIANAKRLSPEIEFRQGDMLALDVPDEAYAGIAAFYSIIHIAREDLERAFCEMKRVLKPGGLLLVAFHLGEETIHLDAWWEKPVCVDFFLFRSEEITQHLRAAGLAIEEVLEREPYPDVEHQSRRAYIFARKQPEFRSQPQNKKYTKYH